MSERTPWNLRRVFAVAAWSASVALLPASADTVIQPGLSGSWANLDFPGQGIFVDVDPVNQVVFMAWFTYGDAAADAQSVIGRPTNRWYVALGSYQPGSTQVDMELGETEGGVFDAPLPVEETVIGRLSLSFESCNELTMDFEFDDSRGAGQVPMTRLIASELCE